MFRDGPAIPRRLMATLHIRRPSINNFRITAIMGMPWSSMPHSSTPRSRIHIRPMAHYPRSRARTDMMHTGTGMVKEDERAADTLSTTGLDN